jgi:hypothetical protein
MAIRTWDCRLITADEREVPLLSHVALPDRTLAGLIDGCHEKQAAGVGAQRIPEQSGLEFAATVTVYLG